MANSADLVVAVRSERGGGLPIRRAARLLRHGRLVIGGTIVALLVLMALAAPYIAPADPLEQDLTATLQGPSGRHLLGTDQLGRDVLSRSMSGARTSLVVAVTAMVAATVLGTVVGVVAGFAGGWVDSLLMGVVEVVLSFPFILLAIVIVAWLGPSQMNAIIALVVTGWVAMARVARSQVLVIKTQVFVEAARAIGCSPVRIAFRHILPQLTSTILVLATIEVSRLMLLEGSLSFLGLGVPLPQPSWGNMLSEGKNYLFTAWWVVTSPAVFFTVAVLGINQLGDGLRDLLDPRLRHR